MVMIDEKLMILVDQDNNTDGDDSDFLTYALYDDHYLYEPIEREKLEVVH